MEASLMAVLNKAEGRLVAETELDALAGLGEDEAIELEARVRRARDKAVGQYRRPASAAVAEHAARGMAYPENQRARARAEAFERALARASHRVAVLAKESAASLRKERLDVARAAKRGGRAWPGGEEMVPRQRRKGPEVTPEPTGERALRSAARERQRAETLSQGARKQAKRDSKR
ncbi:hypothetical protein [Trebonia kvetii]|nr:hypothetical protein [Trebonia kvetii]